MRVVTWNCNRAFRRKAHRIVELDPDILVVPESENPAICKRKEWLSDFSSWRWLGDNDSQGLGLFFRRQVEVSECDWYDPAIKFIRPFRARDRGFEYTVVPVWANHPTSPTFRYIGQVWKFLDKYGDRLSGEVLLLGDLNSNAIWDVWDRWWNHSDVVGILKSYGIESLYHLAKNVEQGSEQDNTFFMHKKAEKGYHIDYVFASSKFVTSLLDVSVGNFEDWIEYSDHCPVVCDFDSSKLYGIPWVP
jgi:exonuclease III